MSKKLKPVIEFQSNEELNTYLRWWQKKLFLTDWVIEAKLAKKITDPKTGDELNGRIEFSFDNSSAFI